MSQDIQLEGAIKFATVSELGVPVAASLKDFSDELASLVLARSRNTVDRKPTFADARTIKRAADLVEQVTANFRGSDDDADGFHQMLWDALEEPPCILYFQAVYRPGLVSATNPVYAGYITVADLDTGGTVAESKWQSKTWSAFGITRGVAPIVLT